MRGYRAPEGGVGQRLGGDQKSARIVLVVDRKVEARAVLAQRMPGGVEPLAVGDDEVQQRRRWNL